ncbi:MAG: hypothetical protein M3515_08770 [Actinomycetota bacterium]|nr:hypothetical protein [Actinomycetota bacterium]
MRSAEEMRGTRGAALIVGIALLWALSGCGQKDFLRDPPRPPLPIQITGVITATGVTVSPDRIGGGPVLLIISNQDQVSHTVILEGEQAREQVGPINPDDAATITTDLTQGRYTVRAGSERAAAPGDQLEPGVLVVGQRRPTGEDDILRP